MVRFNNLIYLLLTLKSGELWKIFSTGFYVIFIIAIVNLVSVFSFVGRLVSYKALFVAFLSLAIMYFYFSAKALDIDWHLIKDSKSRAKASKVEQPNVVDKPVVAEVIPTNEEIQMVEVPEGMFDFNTSFNATFDGGTTEELAEVAAKGIPSKVRRMDERNLNIR